MNWKNMPLSHKIFTVIAGLAVVVWLIYNIVSLSIGAICCEAFSIVSIFVGMYRFDRKKQEAVHE